MRALVTTRVAAALATVMLACTVTRRVDLLQTARAAAGRPLVPAGGRWRYTPVDDVLMYMLSRHTGSSVLHPFACNAPHVHMFWMSPHTRPPAIRHPARQRRARPPPAAPAARGRELGTWCTESMPVRRTLRSLPISLPRVQSPRAHTLYTHITLFI